MVCGLYYVEIRTLFLPLQQTLLCHKDICMQWAQCYSLACKMVALRPIEAKWLTYFFKKGIWTFNNCLCQNSCTWHCYVTCGRDWPLYHLFFILCYILLLLWINHLKTFTNLSSSISVTSSWTIILLVEKRI